MLKNKEAKNSGRFRALKCFDCCEMRTTFEVQIVKVLLYPAAGKVQQTRRAMIYNLTNGKEV